MERGIIAKNLFIEGYNCAQSVVLAFKDILNIDEKQLASLSSSFGGGVSRLREVCGCISGASIVLGLLYGDYDINNVNAKGKHYKMIQDISLRFKEEYKSYLCYELLNIESRPSSPIPEARTASYYQSRPCLKYIEFMANEIEKVIKENGTK